MKNMRRLFALVLAVMMVMTLATTVFAAPNSNPHTISIKNSTEGYSYEAYRVFEGDLNDSTLENIAWSDGVNSANLLAALKLISEFADCETAVDVANVLKNLDAKDDAVTQKFADAVASNLATAAASTSAVTDDKYVLSVTGDGYYFIKTTDVPDATATTPAGVHTRYILEVVGDVEVTNKGSVPQIEKKILETVGSTTSKLDSTDAEIGGTVTFELTATLPSDYNLFKAYTLTFHDTMSKGLTLVENSFKVYVDGTEIANTLYTVKTGTAACDHNTTDETDSNIDVIISNVKDTSAVNGSKITVTYEATLNSNAVVGNPGNPNVVFLEYSNNPNQEQGGTPDTGKTPEDKVVVFTYELDVTKVDGVDKTTTLANASFSLLNADGDKIAKFENGKLAGWELLTDVTATDGVYPPEYTLTTGADGIIKIIGLDAGTYKLLETKAPEGYNTPTAPFEIVITAETSLSGITSLSAAINSATLDANTSTGIVSGKIENKSGTTLPETGGMGTTLFYLFGSVMVMAAVVLLVTKKRMAA